MIPPSLKLLACGLLFALTIFGQSKSPSITGRISDLIGNPIEGATTEILGAEGGPIWRGVTDSTGQFGTNTLSPGTYVVEVAARGFHKERRTVILKDTDALRLDIGLILGELNYAPPFSVSWRRSRPQRKASIPGNRDGAGSIQFAGDNNRQDECTWPLFASYFEIRPVRNRRSGEREICNYPGETRRSLG